MKVSEVKLENFVSINSNFSCWMVDDFEKKELTDADCYYLRYCLMRFIFNNQDLIYDYIDTDSSTVYFNVDEEASVCDDSLCIGNFKGYSISENEKIMSLEMTTEKRVILNVYNTETDKFTYYLID